MAYTVKVYTPAGTLVNTLANVHGLSWLDEHNGTGSGQFTIPSDATGASDCTPGRLARIYDGVNLRAAIRLEQPDRMRMGPGEGADKVTTWRGRGPASVLDFSAVRPEGGPSGIVTSPRMFGWMSGSFDDSGWSAVTTFGTQGAPSPPMSWEGKPEGWPDPDAAWVGPQALSSDATGSYHPDGTSYYRRTFTTASEQDAFVFVAADDTIDLWLDGARLVSEINVFGATFERRISLPAGTHTLAAKVHNGLRRSKANNPTGLLLSIASEASDGSLGPVIVRSDSSWVVDAYPASEPGQTIGDILTVLITDEAQGDYSELDGVTLGFSATVDTDGTAWAEEVNFGVRPGASMLWVLEQLAQVAGVDWKMQPDLTLDVWESRGTDRGATPDVGATTVTLTEGVDIVSSRYPGEGPTATVLLIETPDGFTTAEDAAAISNFGRWSKGVTVGTAPSADGLGTFATGMLAETAVEHERPTVTFATATGGTDTPYSTFDVADVISAPDSGGTSADWRIVRLATAQDDDTGESLWTVELETP